MDGEVVALELFPETVVRAALFEGVSNGGALRDMVVAKALPCEAALVDASLVFSQTVLRSAATHAAKRADHAERKRPHVCRPNDAPKSRSLTVDLVYGLSPKSSVGDALRDFGVAESTRRLLVVAFQADAEPFAALLGLVDGDRAALADLDARRDAPAIAAHFGLAAVPEANVERAILTRLATKDCR